MAMVTGPHKEVFGRLYHSVWNERRLEFIDKLIAPTHALGDPTIAGSGVGPAAYRRQVQRFLNGLPDLKFTVEDAVSEKDKLAVVWTVTGTHKGELLGVPATNRKITFSGITVHQIDGSKIIESTVVWDGLGLLKQLGVNLPIRYEMVATSA